jgi:3-oxoacyl-[acyl-carrier-protein] synthase II
MTGPAPVVVGTGAVSAAGLGVHALWRTVVSGAVLARRITRFETSGYPTDRAGEISGDVLARLDGMVPRHASLAARYLAAAAAEALAQAGVDPRRPGARVGVFVGTVMGVRPVLDRGIVPGRVVVPAYGWASPARLLDVLHEMVTVDGPAVLAAPGCSAGNTAIALGAAAIAAGEVDLAVCGGAEELSHEVFAMFTSLRSLAADTVRPFDADRCGTMLSEGAAVVVLEHPDRAAGRGARPLAAIAGSAWSAEGHHMTAPRPDGAALIATMGECLRRAGLSADDVGWVCAHGTGTPASDGVEASAIAAALSGGSRPPAVSSVKGVLGHAAGAAAALEAVVAVMALRHQFVPGNATMRRADPRCRDIDLVPAGGRRARVDAVLSPALGFGGGVCTILLTGARRADHA